MSRISTDALIASLAAAPAPVRPLAPPLRRGALTLAVLVAACIALALTLGDPRGLVGRYSGREQLMLLEMGAMLLTGVLAVLGAFFLAIPGRSRRWLLPPLLPFLAWISLSGLGCYQDFVRTGPRGWTLGHGMDCLVFLLGASAMVGLPLLWLLSRARPVDPLPVAMLSGVGTAAFAALLLQFFHPFALTAIDLGIHLFAILLVVAANMLSRRRTLAAA